MKRVIAKSLPPEAASALLQYQSEVDAKSTYADRVAAAKEFWPTRSRHQAFNSVKEWLADMCNGPRRCMYCEDSRADEIEHFRPKDLYPEFAFVWDNYLHACGNCNSPKRNRFAVFPTGANDHVEGARLPRAPITEPLTGDPVLIDPRTEDPLDFLHLDLSNTFYFTERHPAGTREYRRAQYTIEVLHLNDRSDLCEMRKNAYHCLCDLLHRYIQLRDTSEPAHVLDRRIRVIRRSSHPTVWEEMKRQRTQIPELKPLFEAAPEALTW